MRRVLLILALLGVATGFAAAQTGRFVAPSLLFDDSTFNYAVDAEGSLILTRDTGANTLSVSLVPGHIAEGLRITTRDADRAAVVGLDRPAARAIIGIEVSDRAIELPFDPALTDPFAVLSYFHGRLPELGFAPSQELFGGNSYVFTCACRENRQTGARLSLDRAGERAYVRLVVELPTAY